LIDLLIDLLIDCCFTHNKQHSSCIQDENKLNNV